MAIKPSLSEAFKSARQTMKQTGAKSVTINYGSSKKDESKKAEPAKPAAAKPSASRPKVQKVETKSAGVAPVKSKTAPAVGVQAKKQEYAKKQSNTSRIEQKKQKLMRKTEKAVSEGNNITAKRLAKRVERKDKRIQRKSK